MNSKITSKVMLLIFVVFSCALLSFMGIYAVQNSYKLKAGLNVSPYIMCGIEYSEDKVAWTNIYDNYNLTDFIDDEILLSSSADSLTLDANIVSRVEAFYLRITNYNADRIIRAGVESFTIDNSTTLIETPTDPSIHLSAICNKLGTGSNIGNIITVNAPAVLFDDLDVIFNLNIEEVVEFNFSKSENLLNENTYISVKNKGNALVELETAYGALLPNTINVYAGSTLLTAGTDYTYSKVNSSILINPNKIIGSTVYIDCDVVQQFKIMEYDNNVNFAKPTNGKLNTELETFQYYMEVGQYPQEYVGDTKNAELNSAFATIGDSNMIYAKGSRAESQFTQTVFNGSINASITTTWVKYLVDNKTYVKTLTLAADECALYATGDTVGIEAVERWYKVEPIRWVILETVDTNDSGTDVTPLSELIYYNYKFYTDILHTQEYTEGFVLLSEAGIDTCMFDSDGATYTNSDLNNFINVKFADIAGLTSMKATSSSPLGNFITYQTLTTTGYANTAAGEATSYTTPANIFSLSYETTDSYSFLKYFGEGTDIYTGFGICCPTDYSLAHYAYSTSEFSDYARTYNMATTATNLGASYWLRSTNNNFDEPDIVNFISSGEADICDSNYIAVRPAMVFALQ